MTRVAHVICAAVAAVLLWRALAQVWLDETTTDAITSEVLRLAIPAFSAMASALAIVAGFVTGRPRRFFFLDAISWGLLLVIVFALTLGRLDREYLGVLFVLALAVRVAPAVIVCVETDRSLPLVFATAFTAYAALAAWHQAAALPLGDQVHYLLVADSLAHGSVDATINADLFRRLSTLTASDFDTATHVFNTPLGPRAIQGYAIPLLLLPGWLAAGRFGAELVVAAFAALASVGTALILRDTIASVRLRGAVWAMTTFLVPAVLLAFHIYPNAFGAAVIGFAYRFGITAPVRRPLLAGIAAGLTLFLNPRDGLVLAVLLVAMLWVGRGEFRRFAIGAAAVGIAAAISNALLYGIPVPYIGYFLAVVYPQALTPQTVTSISFVSLEFWVALPGMLFDRTFGIAGVAPWLFIAVVGIPAALRASRRALTPAAITLGLSLIGLSLYHYWEGGYAPSARYFVDVLPLAGPFVAYGLALTREWWMRLFTGLLIALSALETLVLCAMPSRALNDAFQSQPHEVLDQILGLNPLGWLPSFEQTAPDWYVAAYLRLLPALAIVALLALYGWHRRFALREAVPLHPRSERTQLVGFVAANAVALSIVIIAVVQPWVADLGDVPRSLAILWLPAALAIATGLAAVIGLHLDPERRLGFFARHFALYLVAPLVLLGMRSLFIPDTELGFAYLLVAVGVAVNSVHALWTVIPHLRDVPAAALLGATMLATALVVLPYDRTLAPTASDEPHYMVIVQSIVFDHDLDLANDYAGQRYYEFYPEPLPDVHGIHVGNAIYSLRDMGLPVLTVIPYAVAGRTGVLTLICLFGALLAAQLYLLLRDLAFDRRIALLAVAVTVFVHPFLTYTTQIYPDLIAALMFVTVVRLIRHGTATPLRNLALASAFVGTLPWLTTRAWFVAIGLGLVIAYVALWPRRDLVRRLLAAALPFTALVLLLCYLNWRLFGWFIPGAGYFLIRDQQEILNYAPQSGVPGLLFDRAFGLVPRAPVYLLVFIGAASLWRRRRMYGTPLAALVLGWGFYFLYIADIVTWHADGGPPSRYLLAGLPFLVVAVAGGLETVLASAGRLRTALLVFTGVAVWWSAFVAFVYAVLPDLRYEYMPQIRDGNPVRLWLELGRVIRPDVQTAFPSFYGHEAATIFLALVWVAIAVFLGAIDYVTTRRRQAVSTSAL
ncbi:MAG: hypothetical protein M3T56_15385 [Chloroflexota bacterium]|nr:hypothetical protein [Chloroflexota bacterium]